MKSKILETGCEIKYSKVEEFRLKLDETQVSYLVDFLEKVFSHSTTEKIKKVCNYSTDDVEFVKGAFEDFKKQVIGQCDHAYTKTGHDLSNEKEALKALEDLIQEAKRLIGDDYED